MGEMINISQNDREAMMSFLILLIRHGKGIISTLEKILEYLKKEENGKTV